MVIIHTLLFSVILLSREATLPYLDPWAPVPPTPTYFYRTTEAHRFGITYHSAMAIYQRLDDHIHFYQKWCQDSGTEENENFLFLLRSMRSVFYHLRESLDLRHSPYQRVYHLHQLRLELSTFSVGYEYHWFDLGWLPDMH